MTCIYRNHIFVLLWGHFTPCFCVQPDQPTVEDEDNDDDDDDDEEEDDDDDDG